MEEFDTAPAPATSPAAAMVDHPDFALAQAVLRKDRKATADFVNRFSGAIHGYVRMRLAPRTEVVDDVVQDAFIAAWRNLANYRGTSSLEAWLMGIARHKVEDHYRTRLRRDEVWEPDAAENVASDTHLELDDGLDRRRTSERAFEILGALPEHYSAILLWRYWERQPAREIARQTGRTEKAVERLLARAREQFKRRWLDG